MSVSLTFSSLLVYSEHNHKSFHTTFSPNVNIVRGRNTSGKSTLFHCILYAFGINDVKDYLYEILEENIIVRVDCTLNKGNIKEKLVLIRDDETIYIKKADNPLISFNGVSGNSSEEHIKLKKLLSGIFNFSLALDNKGTYKPAPIEVMFLPYYISQSLGWIYLRKSFSSLDYYRNFKNDYLDYYTGISQDENRIERQELIDKIAAAKKEINFFQNIENNNEDLQLTKITDDSFVENVEQYIEQTKEHQDILRKDERLYVLECNKLAHAQERKTLLMRVKKNHKSQKPSDGICPTCKQQIPSSLNESYAFFQEENDTLAEIESCKKRIKASQSTINSYQKKIRKNKDIVLHQLAILEKAKHQQLTYQRWLKNKANLSLFDNIAHNIQALNQKISIDEGKLENLGAPLDTQSLRAAQNSIFTAYFTGCLEDLKVKVIKGDRYKDLYRMSAFPSQGVELHKTVMAYHFSFNYLIRKNNKAHRFPFLLDSVFNEDFEPTSKKDIINFISKHAPADTQMILSIAESRKESEETLEYKKQYFKNDVKIITIGDALHTRSFLQETPDSNTHLITDTSTLIESIVE